MFTGLDGALSWASFELIIIGTFTVDLYLAWSDIGAPCLASTLTCFDLVRRVLTHLCLFFFNRNFTSWWLDSFFPLTDRYLVLTDCYRVLLGSIGTGIPSPSGEESRTQFTSEWKVINKVAPP